MHAKRLQLLAVCLFIPLLLGLVLVTAVSPQTTHAAPNPIVDTLNDENDGECVVDCSLRDAIALTDAASTITFDASLSGTIVLSSTLGELLIDKNLTINGGNVITVSGDNATRVFNITAGNITFDSLTIISGTVTTNDCGGFSPYTCGGGIMIQNSGVVVTVTNSTLSGNSSRFGGSIFNWGGTITISNSTLSGNSADNDGGGIYNSGGTLMIDNSTLSRNSATRGSGIFNHLSTVTIDSSTLSRNLATSVGGGIYNYLSTVTIDNSTISSNEGGGSGGGINNIRATVAIDNSTISGNSANVAGGGINTDEGTVTVTNSTISGNWAGNSGGGIYTSEGILAIDNSTLSDNSAVAYGGGINNLQGTLTVNNSTIFGNQAGISIINGGGIVSYGDASTFTTLTNSIVVGNVISGTTTAADVSLASAPADSFTSGGHNLIGAIGPNITAFTNGINGDQTGVTNPALGPLANNGGATLTHALLIGSPALDAGDCSSGPATDQRGVSRPQDSTCDIGAFELNAHYIVNVNDDSDDGSCDALVAGVTNCTLREAINAANSLAGDDTITFAPTVSGTILLSATLGDLDINSTMAIDGGNVITVSGDNATRVFNVTAGNVTFDSLTIISGTVTTNDCEGFGSYTCGGGIFMVAGTAVTLTHTTVISNSAYHGGGIFSNRGTLTVNNSTISSNSAGDDGFGGGIHNNRGTLTVTNSTISSNSAGDGNDYNGNGGGIFNSTGGTATVSNSTLSGNSVGFVGGGIFNYTGALMLNNNVLANNTGMGDCASYNGVTDGGFNLVEEDFCELTDGVNGNIIGKDPLLGPLQDNGGRTLTHALLAGSPAIDAGDCSSGSATDQRGVARPIGNGCDMGAFESDAYLLTIGTVGLGAVTQDPAQADYEYGTVVTVTAVSNPGWTFTNWSGHLSGSAISGTVTITGNLAITATFSNDPPTADAGDDQTVETNQIVTLDGSGSFDDDPAQTLTYGWTQTGGTSVGLSSITAVSPTFTAPANAAVLTFALVVTDSTGLPSPAANVSITVQEPGLAAQLTTLPTTARPGDVVWFTLTLTNTGDLTLSNLASETAVGGNFTLPNSIDSGVAASYAYSYTVLPTDLPGPLTNVVTVTAQTPLGSGVSAIDITAVVLEPHTIFLPVVFNNYVSAPDLVVTDVVVSGDDVTVIITNQGNAPVSDPFWVDVYINPTTPPTGINQTWETNGGEGLVWGIENPSLAPGAAMVLTLNSPSYLAQFSNFSGTIAAGSMLYAQADSAGPFVYGNVKELDEDNNIYGPLTTTVPSTPTGMVETAVYSAALMALRP